MTSAPRKAGRVAKGRSARRLARFGFVGKGLLWAVIGLIAFEVARGDRRKAQAEEGAIQEVASGSFGEVLLVLLAIGLAGYALWRARVAIFGAPNEEGIEETVERIGSAVLAVSYAGLFVYTLRFLTEAGGGGGSSGADPDSVTRKLLDEPYGVALVIAIGVVLLGVAIYEAHKALTHGFLEDLERGRMSDRQMKVATVLGTVGHSALAVTSAVAGFFMVKAAIEHEPREAVGLDGALQELADAAGGPLILGAVAVGLLTYSAYCLFEARYRKL